MPRQAARTIAALWLSSFKNGFSPRPHRHASRPPPPQLQNHRVHFEALSQLLGVAAHESVNKDTQRTTWSTRLADRHSTFDDRVNGRSNALDLRTALKKLSLSFCACALASFLGLKPLL
jgi:hypothetical protein